MTRSRARLRPRSPRSSASALDGLREVPVRNAVRDVADRVASNLGAGACAREVLSRYGLLVAAGSTRRAAALRLEAAMASRPESEPGVMLALSELWHRAATRRPGHDPASAVPALRGGGGGRARRPIPT